ncbi:V-type ATPase subunit [Infirmifilum lucidum]|uniref:V-type ATPase subunit n=1 Tax=Infirmifilum lucidum TaxID=2776706 RepID=A0A7L9FF85_9CREN|nr:V-type ATPase subunit [Infirmifilum lucidum]QOJ78291.1 V-type ATPase subunit [Infirmifilum lucidum]
MEAYIAVRAHGLKSRLLRVQDYEAILRGEKKLPEFKDYSLISERDSLEQVLEKIYRVYVSRMEILAASDRALGQIVYALLDRLEIENAKIHFRYILGAQRPVIYYPYGRHIGPARLMQIRTEGSLWEELSKTPYQAPGTPSFVSGLEAEREALLDILYYNYLFGVADSLAISREEREDLRNIVREEFEAKLLLWSQVLRPEILTRLLQNYSKSLRAPIPQLPEEWKTLKLTELIVQVQKNLVSRARQLVAVKYSTGVAYVYYFNLLALTEANNLEKLVVGKEVGLPEEVIQRNLVLAGLP